MKRYVILIAIACLMFASCKAREPIERGSNQEPASSSEASVSIEPESEIPSSPEEESSEEEEPEDTALSLHEEMMLAYGGVMEINQLGNQVMRVSEVSLYYIGDWEGAEAIESGSYYSWYLSMAWKEGLSSTELRAKYCSPLEGDEGWFFPQELYESKIQQYFDVSTEHLRAERLIYDENLQGYYLQGGGGIGERPLLTLDSVTENGDTVTLRIKLSPQDDLNAASSYKLLTVRAEADGGYKFLRCKTE